jgi:hypothetical protein
MSKLAPSRPVLAALLALSFTCSAGAQTSGRRGASKGEVLYDYRTDLPAPPVVVVGAAEEDGVLDATFKSYLPDPARCAPDSSPANEADLAALRAGGQFAPSVSEAVRGSFTGPARQETLYVIAVGECGDMPRSLGSGSTQLVIRRGGENVLSLNGFYGAISAVRDVDGDGADEILLRASGSGQGMIEESARLLSFAGGRERVVHDFETVREDSCGQGERTSAVKAAVLRFAAPTPAAAGPRFETDFYVSRCYEEKDRPRLKDFRFLKRGKLYD